MKKYFLAAAIAVLALLGPASGHANAQSIFTRGGPTFIDKLVGNNNYGAYRNYGGYANYGGYPNYGGYANYGAYPNYYGNRWGMGRCHRNPYRNYGNLGYMGHYHHHHRW